uniref:Uncharacterized protein n=1 Tax=Lactuca sativa TaxID=4236 RepID=A0A9R1W5X5_LACSA|nr:hypothetical protein LSAT_V11C300150690 [Lactuca sativa]
MLRYIRGSRQGEGVICSRMDILSPWRAKFSTLWMVFLLRDFTWKVFFPTCELLGHVIDCWSQVLNLDESKRAPESPLIVYCKTDVTG